LDAVEQREAEFDEEWLVMVAPDHGFNRQKDNGSVDCAHGSQDIDAKKIWVASSHEELLNEQFTSPLSAVGNRDKDGIYRYVAQTDVTP
ncbi:alkaline phosphatase, partial [Vibrio campbellii]